MISYKDLLNNVKNKEITFKQYTESILEKIKDNQHLNAFITICDKSAIENAEESDRRIAKGNPRALEGMIIAVKDNYSTKNIRTTCASKILENYTPVYDATAVKKILDAGAIIIGKTNMDEFAMGSSNETSYFGNVLNPLDNTKVPGGSSGGSASAVAAGLCHVAFGSDTGGSIRQPASFCGIYGVKPSYGRISRYGLIAFASSLDTVGLFASNLDDLSLCLDELTGLDEYDSTMIQAEKLNSNFALNNSIKPNRVGILCNSDTDKCESGIKANYEHLISKIKSEGIEIKEITFEHSQAWIPTYYILATAEASSNLSRFDGVKYGFRAELSDKDNIYKRTRTEGFGNEVKRRIMTGTYVLSHGYYDAYYKKAQKMRRVISDNYKKAFDDVDLIILPATPTSAFGFGDKESNPLAMYFSDFYTATANLAGIPAITIPFGKEENKMPYGIQLQTKYKADEELIAYSKFVENLINS